MNYLHVGIDFYVSLLFQLWEISIETLHATLRELNLNKAADIVESFMLNSNSRWLSSPTFIIIDLLHTRRNHFIYISSTTATITQIWRQ